MGPFNLILAFDVHNIFPEYYWQIIMQYMPFIIFLELPVYIMQFTGILVYWAKKGQSFNLEIFPKVSCIITCYSEGELVKNTIVCLAEQLYKGEIEIIPVIDGAASDKNQKTLKSVRAVEKTFGNYKNRAILVVPKWQRGGRVSSLNAGLKFATGDIVMALDADTSFDNDMVAKSVKYFLDPNVIAVSGALRVRNAKKNLLTWLQALEYIISIHAGKVALASFNIINNVSGAFGIFRTSMIRHIGGWDTGTAEDLDMTLRLKAYMGNHPELKIAFAPDAIGHTDVPETLFSFFFQRLRWDGDLSYMYLHKHRLSFSAKIVGFLNFLCLIWTGLLFQLVLPFVIVIYTEVVCLTMNWSEVYNIIIILYFFYLGVAFCFLLLFILFISERKLEDLKLLLIIPVFPFFIYCSRFLSAFACIWELLNKGHLDSSMAPWWVLKKSRY